MSWSRGFETALRRAVDEGCAGAPSRLEAAIRHAVFPGGARLRPALCLAVAAACGDPSPALAEAAAVSVELIHCASLVHDDLPCFDDAGTRRGRATVHVAHGEPLAVLAGDALIVLAFETLTAETLAAPERMRELVATIARGVGAANGIIAGQAWESEHHVPGIRYRRAKTAALFVAAASAGAIAAHKDPAPWRDFAERIGEAYQIADDIADACGDAVSLGKPVGRDASLGRPNVARDLGENGARRIIDQLLHEALAGLPACQRPERIRGWVVEVAARLLPAGASPGREPERDAPIA